MRIRCTVHVCIQGWHYELEDKDAPLTYKGVVFNEMKGVYSSPDSLHGRACQQVCVYIYTLMYSVLRSYEHVPT
jgi:Zn-dependent M16 (insulinase) family peptidase